MDGKNTSIIEILRESAQIPSTILGPTMYLLEVLG